MQTILEARIEFKDNQLSRITVLVEMSINDVRAIVGTTQPRNGYMNIQPGSTIDNYLLQDVADHGCETVDRDEIFPGWKKRYHLGRYKNGSQTSS